jgi:hypothetical protein
MTLAQLLHADRKTSRAVATIEGALALCRNSQSPDPRQQIMLANLQQRLHKLRADITGESVLQ